MGWKHDLEVLPISFAKLVRAQVNMGLRDSKEVLDKFAAHGKITLFLESRKSAMQLAREMEKIGARCQVSPC